MKRTLIALGLLMTVVSCTYERGVVSGYFGLRDDSPLPSWVVLPKGMSRDQVTVAVTIYEATTTPNWKVRFVVLDKHRRIFYKIQEQMGSGYWHPDSLQRNPPGAVYPNWMIIEVNGIKDVYEQSETNGLLRIVKKPLS